MTELDRPETPRLKLVVDNADPEVSLQSAGSSVKDIAPAKDLQTYRKIALAAMPHLAAYYESWDQGVRPDEASYNSITSELLTQESSSLSDSPWLNRGLASKYSPEEISAIRAAVSKELLVAEDTHARLHQGMPRVRGSYVQSVMADLERIRRENHQAHLPTVE